MPGQIPCVARIRCESGEIVKSEVCCERGPSMVTAELRNYQAGKPALALPLPVVAWRRRIAWHIALNAVANWSDDSARSAALRRRTREQLPEARRLRLHLRRLPLRRLILPG